MRSINLVFLFLFILPVSIIAQTLPTEKLYILTDKTTYTIGDTANVQGRGFRCDSIGLISKYVYIELYDEKDSLHDRQKLVVNEEGFFNTRLPIERDYKNGDYFFRAYTKFMENYPKETFPIHSLKVVSKDSTTLQLATTHKLNVSFYPEGGHLVDNFAQNLSMFFCDDNGQPITTPYTITNAQQDTIAARATSAAGWDILRFIPSQTTVYYLHAMHEGKAYTFPLPPIENTPTLQCTINKNKLFYFVHGNEKDKYNQICVYHERLGLMKWTISYDTGYIDIDQSIEDGIIHIFLMNEQNEIASECHFWRGELYDDKELTTEKEKLFATEQILFESDLFSASPFPDAKQNEVKRADIQAWLFSTSFKRFNVADVLRDGFSFTVPAERKLFIKGYVKDIDGGWPIKNGPIVAFRSSDGKTFSSTTDGKGYFEIPVEDFKAKETFFLEAMSKYNKALTYKYTLINDTLPKFYNWKKHKKERYNDTKVTIRNHRESHFSFTGINELPEVIVQSKILQEARPIPKSPMDEARHLTMEKIKLKGYTTLDQHLSFFHMFCFTMWEDNDGNDNRTGGRGTAKSLGTGSPGRGKIRLFTRRASTLSNGEIPILLDGMRVTLDDIYYTLNTDEIYSMELLTPTQAHSFIPFAINGCLIIQTKNAETNKVDSKGILIQPPLGISNM